MKHEDRFISCGKLTSEKEWFAIGTKQAKEIITTHNLEVNSKLFELDSLDIVLVKYKDENVCLMFLPRDAKDGQNFEIPSKKTELGRIDYGGNKCEINKFEMCQIDWGQILLTVYG